MTKLEDIRVRLHKAAFGSIHDRSSVLLTDAIDEIDRLRHELEELEMAAQLQAHDILIFANNDDVIRKENAGLAAEVKRLSARVEWLERLFDFSEPEVVFHHAPNDPVTAKAYIVLDKHYDEQLSQRLRLSAPITDSEANAVYTAMRPIFEQDCCEPNPSDYLSALTAFLKGRTS